MRHRRRFVRSVFAGLLGVGLSACGVEPRQAASDQSPVQGPAEDQVPVLSSAHPCAAPAASTTAPGSSEGGSAGSSPGRDPGGATFSCATLTVPLDHAGLHPGPKLAEQVSLQVAMADNVAAPRGVLVFLTGGPGQPGVPFATLVAGRLLDPAVVRDYRLVLIDQRGTGGGALQCPKLQQVMGSSDLTVPPASAVVACAQALGERRQFFTTADTVADLDGLRRALRVEKLSFDGVSYGTFVAERYAVNHPDRVSRLVLDSIVPHDNLDPLELAGITRTADVLRMVCKETGCTTDPAQDLSEVVRARHDGPELYDTVTSLTVGKPRLTDIPAALHAAARGDDTELDTIVAAERQNQAAEADELSQGLHASTLCEDLDGPWGDAATPVAGRAAAIGVAVAGLSDAAVFPYDRTAAAANGIAVNCELWPSTPVVPFLAGQDLPAVPVLLLAGDHDLSTPLLWAQQEAARAPQGRLVVIPGSGHSTQSSDNGAMGRAAVTAFLTGP